MHNFSFSNNITAFGTLFTFLHIFLQFSSCPRLYCPLVHRGQSSGATSRAASPTFRSPTEQSRTGVKFTNILRPAFLYASVFSAFMCLQFGFVIFWQKEICAKAARKMLVKLTTVRRESKRPKANLMSKVTAK